MTPRTLPVTLATVPLYLLRGKRWAQPHGSRTPFFLFCEICGTPQGGGRARAPNFILPPWLPLLITQVDRIQLINKIFNPVAMCAGSFFKEQTRLTQFQSSHLSSSIKHLKPQRVILKLLNASRKEISFRRRLPQPRVIVSVI